MPLIYFFKTTDFREYRGSVTGAMAAAAADSGSEDLYTENDRMGRARASTVSLSLSESAQFSRRNLRNSQDESLVRDSMESSSTKGPGPLRMSLPNNGWGRRSMELFDENEDDYYSSKNRGYDEDDGDYLYRSSRRVSSRRRDAYDEDSRPMMASLTMLPNEKEEERDIVKEKEKEKVKEAEKEREKGREKEREKEKNKKEKEKEKEGEKGKERKIEERSQMPNVKEHVEAKEYNRESKNETDHTNVIEKKKEKVIETVKKSEKIHDRDLPTENLRGNEREGMKAVNQSQSQLQAQAQAQLLNDNSLTSAVDMRASHNSDLGSTSGIYEEDVKKSKYKEFMDSAEANKIVKKIPFDDDDDEIKVGKGSDKSGNANNFKDNKNVSTSALSNFMKMNNNDNKNKIDNESKNDDIENYASIDDNKKNNNNNFKNNNNEVQGFRAYNSDDDDDDDDNGSLTFNLSHNNSGNLSGFGSGSFFLFFSLFFLFLQ